MPKDENADADKAPVRHLGRMANRIMPGFQTLARDPGMQRELAEKCEPGPLCDARLEGDGIEGCEPGRAKPQRAEDGAAFARLSNEPTQATCDAHVGAMPLLAFWETADGIKAYAGADDDVRA